MIGPTFVISSYSRIRRRQAPRSMSSARNPKFLADGPFESLGGGPGLVDVREACLREVRLPPSLPAEFRRDRLDDLGGVHGDVGAARDDEAHIVRRLGPEDRGRPGLRSDRLGHRHHKPDPFRHLLFHEGPGHPRRLDGLPGFRRRLLVRRPLESFRSSFHSDTTRSAVETSWSAGTPKISAVRLTSSDCFRTASNAAFPAAYSRRTTPSWMRVDRSSLMSATSLVRATGVPPPASTSHFGISTPRRPPPGTEPP